MSDKQKSNRWHRTQPSRRQLIRWPRLLEIIPLSETTIRDELIATGRLRPVPLGRRSVGFVEDEAHEIAGEFIDARDAKEPA